MSCEGRKGTREIYPETSYGNKNEIYFDVELRTNESL